jgi:adenine phosphoribosyltransferase
MVKYYLLPPFMEHLKKLIREVPDFPKPGINFYDITTLLKDHRGLTTVLDAMKSRFAGAHIDQVLGIEARGFFFAPAIAYAIGSGFVPVRKPKKLPAAVEQVEYALEYGSDTLEIHRDAVQPGQRILIVDDVLATGGTAQAVTQLVERMGGKVVALSFVIELDFLDGRSKLAGQDVHSLLHY